MTGISSSRSRRTTIVGSIERTSPTKPRRGSRWSTRIRPGVLARHADGVRTEPVHHRDDLAVDLADERHAHDVDRLGVGDAPAVDELGLLAEAAHEIGDLRAAAVHDDRVHADEPHQHDVGREQLRELVVLHRVAAVLDHDGLARELADVRQRVGEDVRLLARVLHPRREVASIRWPLTTCAGSRRCTRATGRW